MTLKKNVFYMHEKKVILFLDFFWGQNVLYEIDMHK